MSPKPPGKTITMLVQQGYEHLNDGALPEALDTFSAALAIEPDAPNALRGRGLVQMQLKHWRDAAEDLRRARDLAPEEADLWVELGMSLAMDGRVYPALEVFETLLATHPTCVRGRLEMGLLYLRLGAIPKGRQQLEEALTHRPTPAQRQAVQSILNEQRKLDRKRSYRPDFDALQKQRARRPRTG